MRRSQPKVKYEAKRNSRFSELDGHPDHKKNFFCLLFISEKEDGSFEICLRGQVSVPVKYKTSRSHLAWSTDERNLTDILVIKTNLSHVLSATHT